VKFFFSDWMIAYQLIAIIWHMFGSFSFNCLEFVVVLQSILFSGQSIANDERK
jgi:hypothetical protein